MSSEGFQATEIINEAKQERSSVYDHVDSAADVFMSNSGMMYPWDDAVQMVVDSVGIDAITANNVLENLVNDVVDPVTMVRKSDGRYVGVASYNARDFYYETDQFHDLYGEVTKGVCVPCVQEATFDHQAVAYPDLEQYEKQAQANVAVQGMGSLPKDSNATERRNVLGGHYLDAHTNVMAGQIANEVGPGVEQAAADFQVGGDSPAAMQANLNEMVSVSEVMDQYGISFDQIKQSSNIDTGVSEITVGASLVSGTTIAGNTAVHGGNQGSFNVEDFGTASATSGEVPTSDGAGNLTMSPQTDTRTNVSQGGTQVVADTSDINFTSGTNTTASVTDDGDGTVSVSYDASGTGGIWTEDANSPLTVSASSSGTITLSGQYPTVKCIIESDTSATAGRDIDLQINGDTGANYATRLWSGSSSADLFVKAAFRTGFAAGTEIIMSGEWGTNWSCGFMGGGDAGINGKAIAGSNTNVTSPLNSITLMDDAANNFSVTMSVYGLST